MLRSESDCILLDYHALLQQVVLGQASRIRFIFLVFFLLIIDGLLSLARVQFGEGLFDNVKIVLFVIDGILQFGDILVLLYEILL